MKPNGNGVERAPSVVTRGSDMTFHDITYKVKVKAPGKCCTGMIDKTILHGISGCFKPGMNAILGSTGSGKSSLLDILAARKDPEGLTGDILVDGKNMPSNFKCMSGYVVQDDVVMGTLTVKENLYFSANLRMSKRVSKEEKSVLINDTLTELGLTHCADTKVGSQLIRGISGGERKRTCIGMELINSPSVLFLDEPTTGLDASTAGAVMKLLHRMSRRGRTIIFSIHQPRYSIFKLFDRLMLMSKGNVVYHGPAKDALNYFNTIGYECELHDNPSDFFLDVINGDSKPMKSLDNGNGYVNLAFEDENSTKEKSLEITEEKNSVKEEDKPTNIVTVDGKGQINGSTNGVVQNTPKDDEKMNDLATTTDDLVIAKALAHKYQQSTWNQQIHDEIDGVYEAYKENCKDYRGSNELRKGNLGFAASFSTQFRYMSKRTILSILRDPMATLMQVIVMACFAVVVGLIYFDLEPTLKAGVQDRVGAFFFLVMNQIFLNISSLELFMQQRVVFMHEHANGYYRVSVYFVAKILFDLVPLRVIPAIPFSAIVYYMMGLRRDTWRFLVFTLNLIITSMAGAGFGFLYSALFDVFAIANLMLPMTYVIMMIFSGLLVNLETMASWIQWLKYISIFRYSWVTLTILEMKDMEFCDYIDGGSNTTMIKHCDSEAGNNYMKDQGIDYHSHWDLWHNQVALVIIFIITIILTYIKLRRLQTFK